MKKAPVFILPSVKEGDWTLEDATKKVTMLTFWTSWCPDSQRDLQAKHTLYKSLHTNDIEMVMIHVTGRDPDVDVSAFLQEHNYTFPVLKDTGTKVYDQYHCMGVPTTVLIDENKNIAFIYHDRSTIMDIMQGVATLIGP
ncbi:TlpA disulfide reductase family protein [Halalkalibacter alkalisediminis]|uniref:TlpA disulfide reductase family protein n=1 Tax=Halalkalibacter alkalisediminis TaxID=935616 RepID=A0ABV6NGQ6_9BACI|nr:TlpA disulfide reductase family protein [Halalkalibacter alkalisediminis]